MSSPRALPTWAYIPGSNRGLAAVGSKQCSRGAKRVPAGRSTADQFFAKPNMSFAPELYLETEQLGLILENELPDAVGWVPPVQRQDVVARQLQYGKPLYTVRTAEQILRGCTYDSPARWRS